MEYINKAERWKGLEKAFSGLVIADDGSCGGGYNVVTARINVKVARRR